MKPITVNQAGVIVINAGMFAIGFLEASAVAIVMAYLWPLMQIPTALAAFLGYTLGAIVVMLRARGKREFETKWPSLSKERESAPSRTNTLLNAIGCALWAFVFAALLAGLAGLVLPQARWPVLLFGSAVSVYAGVAITFNIDLEERPLSRRERYWRSLAGHLKPW